MIATSVADPDLQIAGRRGGSHLGLEIRGGLKTFVFRPFGPQFDLR